MPDPFSLFALIPIPVWALVAGLFVLITTLIWAALPWLMETRRYRPLIPGTGAGVTALLVLLGLIGLVLFLGAVGTSFAVIEQSLRGARESGEGLGLGSGALIAALLGAPFLIWTTWLRHRTVEFQKEGHMTDRISKAVEQLGAEKTVKTRGKDAEGRDITIETSEPNLEVRIGAILSLERIAQDSTRHDKGRDHVRVMEILCAYIRHNARVRDPRIKAGTSLPVPPPVEGQKPRLTDELYLRPRDDIQQILYVIGRRTNDQLRAERSWPSVQGDNTALPYSEPFPEVRRVGPQETSEHLAKQDVKALSDWRKQMASLSNGYRLDLSSADLRGANLSRGKFDGANFRNSKLERARLWHTSMRGADLISADLRDINAQYAKMDGAALDNCNLSGANLNRAWLRGAYIQSSSEAIGLSLIGAHIEGAWLWGMDLDHSVLVEAITDHRTRLDLASLKNALLWRVDLSTIGNFHQIDLTIAFGDASVALPKGIDAPPHWPSWCYLHFDDFHDEYRLWIKKSDRHGFRAQTWAQISGDIPKLRTETTKK